MIDWRGFKLIKKHSDEVNLLEYVRKLYKEGKTRSYGKLKLDTNKSETYLYYRLNDKIRLFRGLEELEIDYDGYIEWFKENNI